MTLEVIQADMISAWKSGNMERKNVLSSLIGAIKKAAIDANCRDNIPESLVDSTLLKEQKVVQEQIDTCPESHAELKATYERNKAIIDEYAPHLMTDEGEIMYAVMGLIPATLTFEKKNRGAIMKIVSPALKGKADMSIVAKVVGGMLQ